MATVDESNQILLIGEYEKFLLHLANLPESYNRYTLMKEAIKVASIRREIHVFEKLAAACSLLDQWDRQQAFREIITALVELGEITLAAGLVTFNRVYESNADAWYMFAKVLLEHNDFDHLKGIYLYLQNFQREVAKACLAKLKLPEQIVEWLDWFAKYSATETYFSTTHFQAAIDSLAIEADFSAKCKRISQLPCNKLTQELIQRLLVKLIINHQQKQSSELLRILPQSLNWLKQLTTLPENEQALSHISKLGSESAKELISFMFPKWLRKNISNLSISKLLEIAALVDPYDYYLIEIACNLLIEMQQTPLIFAILPHLSSYLREQIILDLLKQPLSSTQYSAILQSLENLQVKYTPSSLEKILEQIPQELLKKEQQRRASCLFDELEISNIKSNSIDSSHQFFEKFRSTIKQLLRYQAYDAALRCCYRLSPSKFKDKFLTQIYQDAILQNKLPKAQRITFLINDSDFKGDLKKILTHLKNQNYQQSLLILLKIQHKDNLTQLTELCIEKLLAQDPLSPVINFFVDINFFGLWAFEWWGYFLEDLKLKIAISITHHYVDSNALKDFLEKIPSSQRVSISEYLLKACLQEQKIAIAIEILNSNIEDTPYGTFRVSRELQETFEDRISSTPPSLKLFQNLSKIKDKCILSNVIRTNLLTNIKKYDSHSLEIIFAIPETNMKFYYLRKVILYGFLIEQIQLSKQAIEHLSEVEKKDWQTILEYVSGKRWEGLINFILRSSINNEELLLFTILKWLEGKQPSYMLAKAKIVNDALKVLNRNKITHASNSSIYSKIYKYNLIFRNLLSHWLKLLEKNNSYIEIVKGFQNLLPTIDEHTGLIVAALKRAAKYLFKIEDKFSWQLLNDILKFSRDFPRDFLDGLLNDLLTDQSLNLACELIERVKERWKDTDITWWVDTSYIKICNEYFLSNDYQKPQEVIAKIQSQYGKSNLLNSMQIWIIKLIDKKEIKLAEKLINLHFTNASETIIVKFIEAFSANHELILANQLIEQIRTPHVKLQLQGVIANNYLKQLGNWIGQERTSFLESAQQKITKILRLITKDPHCKQANSLKNELIIDLRSQLDKAFLEFYRNSYGEPPKRSNNSLNVYFPVVPELKGQSVENRLLSYFMHTLKIPTFSSRFPALYQYLLNIQPLHNYQYLWLSQLYQLANIQKHDSDLPLSPRLDKQVIDMATFLPTLINGVTELLIKLFQPQFDIAYIKQLCFNRFVPHCIYPIEAEINISNFQFFNTANNSLSATRTNKLVLN